MRITPLPYEFIKKTKKMANDNHLSSVTLYNVIMNKTNSYNNAFLILDNKKFILIFISYDYQLMIPSIP
ncbi:hypothetical protein SAMN05216313_1776 [Enterocloster lavalensis]|uniref:Uncharacterized protein n=1 Tax=Enterocloster lavalensis TaxID=460384 RepID=A0A1I0KF40_9FIRM|nr:hypothetical protein SAMN05216313_1776 [Enterocloster lavalensis]